jgi:leader peptidase (prepilin peptidase)/N-methyltransferase
MNILLTASFEASTGLPEWIAYVFIFAVGACVGSFLNVVIHRVPIGESVVFPNSACPKCRKPIGALDNIPLISWLILGGKCRNCKEPISARYPAVELLTALLFVLVYWRVGASVFLPVAEVFVAVMVALIFIDAAHMILPNVITYPLFVFALAVRVLFPMLFSGNYFSDLDHWPWLSVVGHPEWLVSLGGALLGAVAGGGFLWFIGEAWKRLRGVEAMGLGDVKMMAGVGALLGWRLVLLSIFLGAFSGAIAGVVILARQKDRDLQMQLPFGIFLGIGAVIAMLFGEQLIAWYIATFVP